MRSKAAALCLSLFLRFKPPAKISVREWADQNRILNRDSSAEPGKWRSDRTPYMIPIMEAFTDPRVTHIYVKASAQVGKSELLNNCFGYIVDIDPGSILWIHPTVEAAEDYSKQRIAGLIKSVQALLEKIAPEKSRSKGNTILKKSFVGGFLALVGSNAPSGLRSRPIRYVLGDEWDAWSLSAGEEGDPAKLAEKRTATFFNRKILMVSTPTIKGKSRIDEAFLSGTQEEWSLPCPNCGEHHYIEFRDIVFEYDKVSVGREVTFKIKKVEWRCPDCGFSFSEIKMKCQQGKMVSKNPDALDAGIRSFRLNAFISPWTTWESIIQEFLSAGNDPFKLKVVYNTLFGEVFEDRGELEDEESMLERLEEYPSELPDGALFLTCGVDTQDNRLEYEVVGYGHYGENWGIKKGFIMGDPKDSYVWEQLDEVIDKTYKFKDGKGLRISLTGVDSGGHRTKEVYQACHARYHKRVFAIKGKGGESIPYVSPASKVPIDPQRTAKQTKETQKCFLYTIGVDAGKSSIMAALKVQTPGRKYCHFPSGDDRGYNLDFFNGLLSEVLVLKRERGRDRWAWEKLPGHTRNEALDCRNYANAMFEIRNPDLDAIEKRLRESGTAEVPLTVRLPPPQRKRRTQSEDW